MLEPAEVRDFQDIINSWMRKLLSVYNFGKSEMRSKLAPWLMLHRHYLESYVILHRP